MDSNARSRHVSKKLVAELRRRLPIALAIVVFGAPLTGELVFGDRTRKFGLVAADTFYYLTVARNSWVHGRVSFDGERLTNGFHPAWQALTTVIFGLVHVLGLPQDLSLTFMLAVGILLGAAAIGLLGLALSDDDGDLTPFFVVLPVGLSTAAFAALSRAGWGTFGRTATTLWSSVNGMETALVLASYAAVALAFVRADWSTRHPFLFGHLLAGLAFSRLDHAVFSLVIAVATAFVATGWKARLVPWGVLVLWLLAYLALNRMIFGIAVPVSGALKSTFPNVTPTNLQLLHKLFGRYWDLAVTHAQRAFQIFIPSIVALLHLTVLAFMFVRRRRPLSRLDLLLASTAVGVLLLAAYDYLYVPKLNQGFWYFPVSHLYVSLVGIRALSGVRVRGLSKHAHVLAIVLSVLTLFAYGALRSEGGGRGSFYYTEGPRIAAFYAGRPTKIVEYDDGIITFATGLPALSGMGLAVDTDAIDAAGGIGVRRSGRNRLLDLGIRRGFTHFCSLSYLNNARLRLTSTDREIRRAYGPLIGDQARGDELYVDYLSADGSFAIVAVRSRPPTHS